MAGYFSYFPNIYVGEGILSGEGFKYRLTKNLFRRLKVRDDLNKYVSTFEAYSIKEGETPSSLAYRLYDDTHLDWAILILNDVIDVYDQWPKEQNDLDNYVESIYSDVYGIHHYETNEVLYNDIVFIKEGILVNNEFRAILPDGTTKTAEESRTPITNYEHEYYLNEQKRLIVLPQPGLIDLMEEEMRTLLAYQPNIEIDDQGNKITPMSISTRFINNKSSSTGSGTTATSQSVSSFDNGPATGSVGVSTSTATTTAVTTAAASTSTATIPTTSTSSSSSSSSSGGGYGGY
ncbi:baseplate wedge component [Synechococcus phage S-CAM8]|jgi:hypothetical protein|uniref:Baseplate wedge component n=1 Tax=Synechococcus phage S-CAM8 TaxID=754038 RepID=A0A1D8KMQ6_9CAUD|nr:baseplate wedge component [Synechococcus phage S-CAM8]